MKVGDFVFKSGWFTGIAFLCLAVYQLATKDLAGATQSIVTALGAFGITVAAKKAHNDVVNENDELRCKLGQKD